VLTPSRWKHILPLPIQALQSTSASSFGSS